MYYAHPASRRANGFTLVELSVVLVIIALLIGGIMVGRSMIRDSQLKAMVSEVTRYKSALNAFREEYRALPGDMPNATQFWGVAGGDGTGLDNACYAAVGTGTATCNGNNNSQIEWNLNTPSSGLREDLRAWQHLANAGMIDAASTGTATGTGNTCGFCVSVGINVPQSRVTGAGWTLSYIGTTTANAQWFDAEYGNALFNGRQSNYTSNPVLTPAEAYLVDLKIDDGNPATGNMLAWKSTINPSCTTSDSLPTAYNATYAGGNACAVIFKSGW